jgi:hypothetical protein
MRGKNNKHGMRQAAFRGRDVRVPMSVISLQLPYNGSRRAVGRILIFEKANAPALTLTAIYSRPEGRYRTIQNIRARLYALIPAVPF